MLELRATNLNTNYLWSKHSQNDTRFLEKKCSNQIQSARTVRRTLQPSKICKATNKTPTRVLCLNTFGRIGFEHAVHVQEEKHTQIFLEIFLSPEAPEHAHLKFVRVAHRVHHST